MDIMEPETKEYEYKSGVVCRALSAGKACADTGFSIASKSTSISVNVARIAITTTASVSGLLTGNAALVAVLYGVDTTVGAAERVAQAAILLSQSLTKHGLNAASATLEYSGAAESIENSIWSTVRGASTKMQWQNHTDAITQILRMVTCFTVPLRELSNGDVTEGMKKYALLQQAQRLPVSISGEAHEVTEDLSRCMGFAAAAYGRVAINFLEYLPRGTFQADILAHLTPGVTAADIIVESQQESIFRPGYKIILDHEMKDVVLTIRGTMNPHDVITDLTCQHTPCDRDIIGTNTNESPCGDVFNLFNQGSGVADLHFAHEGFLRSAAELSGLLEPEVSRLLSGHPGYGLLLCGHSLGAGVASLLAVKWASVFPQVRCVALAPPCVLSLEAARSVSNRVTSVVVGDDMVCRFGIGTSMDLRDACVALHERPEIFGGEDTLKQLREKYMVHPKLYPAGKIIHITQRNEFATASARGGSASGAPTLIKENGDEVAYFADQLSFSEMQVSGTMFSAHMPHKVLAKIREFFPVDDSIPRLNGSCRESEPPVLL